MRRPGSFGIRVLLGACAGAAAFAVGLIVWSRFMPVYSVPYEQARDAYMAWCDGSRLDRVAGDRYFAMLGWRYSLANSGVSLFAAAFTAAIGGSMLQDISRRGSRLSPLRTPSSRAGFIAIGVVAMVLTSAGIIFGLTLDMARQMFPTCADSMGIPLGGVMTTLVTLTPLLAIIGLLISLGFGKLPIPLMQWDSARPVRSWLVTLVFGILILIDLFLVVSSLPSADVIGPGGVLTLYLLAATRAALLAPKAPVLGTTKALSA